jgi:AcrR family transcriptional regulator
MVMRAQRATRMPPDARRAAIIDATLPLVLEHGDAVSTRLIAEAAGVAEGTIFRVFPDKAALMCAVMAKVFDPSPTLAELATVDRALPLRERLVSAVEILQRRLNRVFVLLTALRINGPPPESATAEHASNAMNDAFRAAMVDIVGADRNALRVPPDELAHVMRLLIFSATHPMISDDRPMSAGEIVDVLLDGLRARATTSTTGD